MGGGCRVGQEGNRKGVSARQQGRHQGASKGAGQQDGLADLYLELRHARARRLCFELCLKQSRPALARARLVLVARPSALARVGGTRAAEGIELCVRALELGCKLLARAQRAERLRVRARLSSVMLWCSFYTPITP
jgi:hypothetical protein